MPDYESRAANPYGFPTAEEVTAAPGSRELKAARNVATRKFQGIPQRAFLLGENDHSPVLKGIVDLTTAVYGFFESVDWNTVNEEARASGLAIMAIMENPVLMESAVRDPLPK